MFTTQITIELPTTFIEQVTTVALKQQRSISEMLQNLILQKWPALPALPLDIELELASFDHLSDDTLWILARTSLSSKEQKQLSKLNNLAQKRELTAREQERQQALIDAYDRTMIRRAQAALTLKNRGFDMSDPKVLKAA